MISTQAIDEFFAWAPITTFVAIVVVAYFMTRTEALPSAPIGKTYSCARCGRRGAREQMVSVSKEGAVLWYCGHCAQPELIGG
ncbi:MAG TPA: hypothetical protein VGR69_07135 [Candidatus Rubrimentiphilum sp.]|nr:hypothetical protein [Candidatus Rubrimentiphilum sp.]